VLKKTIPGRHCPTDRILLVKTREEWEPITFKDFLDIQKLLMENEDRRYPKPEKMGRDMLWGFMGKVHRGETFDECKLTNKKEEVMALFGDNIGGSMFFKVPMGGKATCKILDMGVVEGRGDGKFDPRYKNNPEKELFKKEGLFWTMDGKYPDGFSHQGTVEEGGESKVWTINARSLTFAIDKAGVDEGDTIEIERPEKGVYNIKIVEKGKPTEEVPF